MTSPVTEKATKMIYTLRCRSKHNLYNLSHHNFCQSAQYLRSSGGNVKNLRTIKIDQGKPVILMGQSIFLGEVKAEAPLHNENPMNDQIIWQQYIQQVESLSPENKVSNFCKEAGFVRVVEVGQYFVTKDTGSLSQFRSVTCREYTLPRDDPTSQAKGWIQGNMRIGPVLEVTTSFQHFKYGLKFEFGRWIKTILNLGSEFLTERSNM